MRSFLYRIILVLAVAFVLLECISFLLINRICHSNFYKPSVAFNNQNKQYEYIILGSSRGLTTLDTKQVDEALGTKGYNFSIDDTGIQTHELTLEHLISCGIKFKYLVLAYDNTGLETTDLIIGANDHRFLPFIHRSYIHKYFRDRSKIGGQFYTLNRIFPFLGLGYFNIELLWPSIFASINPKYRYRSDNYGNYSYPNINSTAHSSNVKRLAKLNTNNQALNQILDICSENKITPILFYAPHQDISIVSDNMSGIPLDIAIFNYSDSLSDSNGFYDHHHVNAEGRKAVTNIFIKDFSTKRSISEIDTYED